MANYNVTTKVIVSNLNIDADSVAGYIAKEVTDYLETVDDSKTIHALDIHPLGSSKAVAFIVHNS